MPRTKIRKIRIKGYKQFQDLTLDFTNPQTGEAADRICFIGRNGTGKSTILDLLRTALQQLRAGLTSAFSALEVEHDGRRLVLVAAWGLRFLLDGVDGAFERMNPLWAATSRDEFVDAMKAYPTITGALETQTRDALQLQPNSPDLLTYCPAEVSQNVGLQVGDVPPTNLNEALALSKNFPFIHEVSGANVSGMWRTLVHLVNRRELDRQAFETREANLDKLKRQLIEEFNSRNPPVLEGLAELWNPILEKAGLEFDVASATLPVQLTDNLQAYIRHSSKAQINYNRLSTGIRNFIFRIGHIYLLYFNRKIERGFLLIDEPENSLFPDFLFELMETYNRIVRNEDGSTNTQMFVATHSPIVAAQFQPWERIILEWNDEGSVSAKKGVAPIGDDPNDLLEKDFELTHLMGAEGLKMWDAYLALRKQLRRSTDKDEKLELMKQAAKIGRDYGFEE